MVRHHNILLYESWSNPHHVLGKLFIFTSTHTSNVIVIVPSMDATRATKDKRGGSCWLNCRNAFTSLDTNNAGNLGISSLSYVSCLHHTKLGDSLRSNTSHTYTKQGPSFTSLSPLWVEVVEICVACL
ncbi:hypothetical protein D3C85_1610500 [compost metagenome]